MRELPINIGVIHFIGIGGIGMSGIAEILHNLGYVVQGSDLAENPNVKRLINLGIKTFIGQQPSNIKDASIVIISSAINESNPELQAAKYRQIPVVHRAEMLGELMRLKWAIACAGTHGKTTTTSLVAAILDSAQLDATVINGGIINSYGTNARIGSGDWMVVEADESDGSFNKLPATIAIVTNIDPEHLDFHGSFETLQEAFRIFISNIPFYGFAVVCIDHPVVRTLIPKVSERRIVTYGIVEDADVRAINIVGTPKGNIFDVAIRDRISNQITNINDLSLPMFGEHNVLNALAAIAVAGEMGIEGNTIRAALCDFQGVNRRFTKTGEVHGITIIDDYGHHPVEIAAVLKAARSACGGGRIIAVMQPHRYSRLANLFQDFCECFDDSDFIIVADVYSAGEKPIPGADRDSLVKGLKRYGHSYVDKLNDPVELAARVADIAKNGDYVICLGAGSISSWAQSLPSELDHVLSAGPNESAEPSALNQNKPISSSPLEIKAGKTKGSPIIRRDIRS